MPKVYEHTIISNYPVLYASKWFITVFCYSFPFDFVYRIWDVYLHEGIKFVFRVALALMKVNETEILKINRYDAMMKFLQNIQHHCHNIDYLLSKAFDLPLKHEHLHVAEDTYNRQKLAEDRDNGRQLGRSRRGRQDRSAAMQEIAQSKSAHQIHLLILILHLYSLRTRT